MRYPQSPCVSGRSETEAKNIRTRRHDHILLAVDHICHGGGFHEDVGGELPERFSVSLIHCREDSVRVTIENQASRSGENPRPGLSARVPRLGNLPNDLSRVNIQGAQEALALLVRVA